jgi:hypothetical protein
MSRSFDEKTIVPANPSGEKEYLCEYSYLGKQKLIEIFAESRESAEIQLQCISRGKVLGEIEVKIPVSKRFEWAGKLLAKLLRSHPF